MKPSLLRLFFWISGSELFAAAGVSLLIAPDPKNAFLLGFSKTRLVLVGGLLLAGLGLWAVGLLLERRAGFKTVLERSLSSSKAQEAVAALVLLGGVTLFGSAFSPSTLARLAPALIGLWLVGLEWMILAGRCPRKLDERSLSPRSGWIAALTALCLYAALALPARVPAHLGLDGLPWDQPLEFALAALVLPLALLVNRRFFALRKTLAAAVVLLALRAVMTAYAPQSGLDVRLFTSQEQMRQGQWQHSYASLLDPTVTTVLNGSYDSYRQFPMEWINRDGFDRAQTWITLDVSGYIILGPWDQLAVLAQGLEQGSAELTNLDTGESYPVPVLDGSQPVALAAYDEARLSGGHFRLNGRFIYQGNRQYQFKPVVMQPNFFPVGSPLLAAPTFWRSPAGLDAAGSQTGLLAKLDFDAAVLEFGLLALVLAGLLLGVERYQRGELQAPDLYLALSGVALLAVLKELAPAQIETLTPYLAAGFALARLVGFWAQPSGTGKPKLNTALAFLLSVGVPVLVVFFSMEMHNLREVFFFPPGQDNFRYQVIARNIFVNGDWLLLGSPPLAYKFLFPYLVGLLHLLFGQSPSALLLSNTWFAAGMGMLLISIQEKRGLPGQVGFAVAALQTLTLCLPSFLIFFHRFGLIEPIATFGILLGLYLLQRGRMLAALGAGVLVVLFRLDYLGAVYASLIVLAEPLTGSFRAAWNAALAFAARRWKLLLGWLAGLLALPVAIILFYSLLTPNYMLRAGDTQHSGLSSVLEGLFRILVGGRAGELRQRFQQMPVDAGLVSGVLVVGGLVGLGSLVYRWGVWRRSDLRWGILILGLLAVYVVVKPTGYSPRFSTPLLPLGLIAAADGLRRMAQREAEAVREKQAAPAAD